MQDYKRAMDQAKVRLMQKQDSAFFTTVAFSLKHIWDPKIETAATNGTEIRYNPDFFMSLSVDERVFLILHESMHVAYLHMERLQSRNRKKWNIAADHVINLQLLERGFEMPAMGLADPKFKGMSTEQVYELLDDKQAESTSCMMDLEPLGEGGSNQSEKEEQVRREVEDILVRAAIQSKMANDKPGTIPGDIEIFINGLLNPKLPWQQILRKFLNSMNKNDYSWRRPNRRFFPEHYLPGLWSESLMDLAIAVDASGSVSEEDFHQFVSETHNIIKHFKPEKIALIQFDAGLRSVDEIRSVQDLMRVRFTGRGGTLIEPVMEWAETHKPKALLVFTDGEFRIGHYTTNPKMPVVWLIHNNSRFQAPFGKVIHYELEH